MKKKQWFKIGLLLSVTMMLVACGNMNEPVSAESVGIWDRYIVYNLSQLIIWFSNLFGQSYPTGIAILTIIIRVLLTPLYQMQVKSQREMMELQPELDAIKAKYPNKDRQSQELIQHEQQALMSERGVNQFAGCFPLLIQLPVMMALYQSILRTPELRQGHFLWMNLGQPDPYFILPIIAAVLTFAATYFSMKSNPNTNAATKGIMLVNPIMILLIAIRLPSAIALYWVVSNAATLVMTFLFNNPYKIIAEREAKIKAEKEKQRELRRQYRKVTGRNPKK